jgi:hypothetical protein
VPANANNFAIMEQMWPEPSRSNRFRVVEHVITSDGVRSRLTNTTFATLNEAKEFIRKKEHH